MLSGEVRAGLHYQILAPPPKKNALSKLSEDHLCLMCAQKRKMSESYVYQEEEAGTDLLRISIGDFFPTFYYSWIFELVFY